MLVVPLESSSASRPSPRRQESKKHIFFRYLLEAAHLKVGVVSSRLTSFLFGLSFCREWQQVVVCLIVLVASLLHLHSNFYYVLPFERQPQDHFAHDTRLNNQTKRIFQPDFVSFINLFLRCRVCFQSNINECFIIDVIVMASCHSFIVYLFLSSLLQGNDNFICNVLLLLFVLNLNSPLISSLVLCTWCSSKKRIKNH